MAEEIAVQERESQVAVEVPARVRLWQVPTALASGFAVARESVEKAGGQVDGMPFARYLGIDWPAFRSKGAFSQFLEVLTGKQEMRSGLFTTERVECEGPAISTEIPAGRYVTAIHRGAYHKVGDTYRRVYDWAVAEGIGLADNTLEHYIDDPTVMPMPEVRTRIWIAVV